MGAKRTQHSRFESRYGGGWLAPHQFLAESMCARVARRDKNELPHHFWKLDRWKREFLKQNRFAIGLLKLYSVDAIIKALRTHKGQTVYSLGAPFLDPLIQIEQERIVRQSTRLEQAPDIKPAEGQEAPRPTFVQSPSKLNKLRDLDG